MPSFSSQQASLSSSVPAAAGRDKGSVWFTDRRPEAAAVAGQVQMIQRKRTGPGTQPVLNDAQVHGQPIVQMQGGWWGSLLGFVQQHPYIAAATLAAGGLTALYLYYSRSGGSQPARLPAPDPDSVEGIATALGITAEKLQEQLDRAPGEEKRDDVFSIDVDRAFHGSGVNRFPGLVPASLTDNLTGSNVLKVYRLFLRFNNLPFLYNGRNSNVNTGFLNKYGDCMTLASMFQLAAEAAGIQGVTIHSLNRKMLVEPAPIHGRNAYGNVHNQLYWFFHDHHWCVYKGTKYDLLFMSNETPETHLFTETKNYKGISYDMFSNGACMIHAENMEGLNFELGRNDVGLVRRSKREMKQFIDQYKR